MRKRHKKKFIVRYETIPRGGITGLNKQLSKYVWRERIRRLEARARIKKTVLVLQEKVGKKMEEIAFATMMYPGAANALETYRINSQKFNGSTFAYSSLMSMCGLNNDHLFRMPNIILDDVL